MKIKIPTECPCCNSKLELVKDQLFCRNKSCEAQTAKRVEHFCKTLGIKGMGAKTIEKLELGDITEIFYLDKQEITTKLNSEKIAEKLLDEIDKSKSAPLAIVLASFSIPLMGSTASNKLCTIISTIDDINLDSCKKAGLGDKVTYNLLNWLETEFTEMKQFLPFSFRNKIPVTININKQNICITGKLSSFKTKAEAYSILKEHGFNISETVNKSLSYLVDEEDNNSSKRKKADQLGIKIITNLQTFLREYIND